MRMLPQKITILGCKCTLKNENMHWMYQVDVYEFPVFYLLRNKVKKGFIPYFLCKKICVSLCWMDEWVFGKFARLYKIAWGEVYCYEKCQDVWHLVKILGLNLIILWSEFNFVSKFLRFLFIKNFFKGQSTF